MKYIEFENRKRREHVAFFYKPDYPQYNIRMDVDITKFPAFTRKEEVSFYDSMIYAVTSVINDCENFKYRIRDGKVNYQKYLLWLKKQVKHPEREN